MCIVRLEGKVSIVTQSLELFYSNNGKLKTKEVFRDRKSNIKRGESLAAKTLWNRIYPFRIQYSTVCP